MRHFTFLILSVLISLNSYSNQSCGYITTKQGVTIISIGSCQDSTEQQREVNSYLDFLLEKLNYKDKDLYVLILLGDFGVHRPRKDFISVAYDTLSKADTVFIDDSELKNYDDIYHLSNEKNWFLNYVYPSEIVDSIYNSRRLAGLKIRFYGEFDTTQNYYDRILSIAEYAIKNLNEIKKRQEYIKMPYDLKGQKISVLTLDTGILNSIKAKPFGFLQEKKSATNNTTFAIIGAIVVSLVSILVLLTRRKYNH